MRHEVEMGKVVYVRYLCDLVSLHTYLRSSVSFHVNINQRCFDDPAIRFLGFVLAMSFLILPVHSLSNRLCRPSQITRVDPWMTQSVTTLSESFDHAAQIGYSGIRDVARRGGLDRKQLTSSCLSVPTHHAFLWNLFRILKHNSLLDDMKNVAPVYP